MRYIGRKKQKMQSRDGGSKVIEESSQESYKSAKSPPALPLHLLSIECWVIARQRNPKGSKFIAVQSSTWSQEGHEFSKDHTSQIRRKAFWCIWKGREEINITKSKKPRTSNTYELSATLDLGTRRPQVKPHTPLVNPFPQLLDAFHPNILEQMLHAHIQRTP